MAAELEVGSHVLLRLHYIETDSHSFSAAERRTIESEARDADSLARRHLPLSRVLNLLVEPSSAVIAETGDNAETMEPHLIRWRVDPRRGIETVAEHHLKKAFLHEAYHAARFRGLRHEADGVTWLRVALQEGLATVFARDVGDANEAWALYDAGSIERWAAELVGVPFDRRDTTRWKFEHEDGRQWIAFRVGSWLVDRLSQETGQSAAELVSTPIEELERMLPLT